MRVFFRRSSGTESGKDGEAAVIGLAEERALFVRTGHHSAHTGEFRDGAGAGLVALIGDSGLGLY